MDITTNLRVFFCLFDLICMLSVSMFVFGIFRENFNIFLEAIVLRELFVGSIPTRGNKIFNICISPIWHDSKRGVGGRQFTRKFLIVRNKGEVEVF